MDAIDHRRLATALLPAVQRAGAVIMGHYRAGVSVETKADRTPVTIADAEAEAILIAALEESLPGVPVIAEEAVAAGRVPDISRAPGRRFFLVDPLDGTREFINKRDEFTVNIGLVEAGRPVFGVVYAPVLERLCITVAPGEAVEARLAADGPPATLDGLGTRRLRVRLPGPGGLTVVASRSHLNEETRTFIARYRVADMKNAGSSLKFCLLARGEADLYPRLGPTMEWDTAAGHAVLAAAGGSVTLLDGGPFTYGHAERSYRNPHFVAWGGAPPTAGP